MLALFGLKLHWGDPKHPTELRSWTGALGSNDRPWQHCYVSHEIGRWFGLSHKRNWFVGFFLTERTDEYRTAERPRFGWGAEIGERPSDIPMADESPALIAQAEAPSTSAGGKDA
jgi:hypothetical protein